MLTPKAWGSNEVLHSTPAVKVVRLHILPGGFCSWHHHAAKDNTFVVEEGTLTIQEEGEAHTPPMRTLCPGEHHTVPPGRVHRFVNYSSAPARVLEVESVSLLSDEDIFRTTEGGILGKPS